ncbi:hypothetical protein GCM10009531_89370 [Actinoplanes capillaceus]
MADKGNRGSLAVMAGIVVLLHLAGFWALDGLPPQFPLGVFVVAYLLGMRWAFEPGNTAAVDRAGDRIAGLGRSSTMAAFWFALGFATTVYVLAVLFTIGLQMLAWRDRPVILDGSFTGVFLGIFGILQFVALIGAVRMRRDGSSPPVRLEGFLGRVSSAWQLFPVGLLLGFGLFLAVEVGLLVLAAGQLALVAPMYLTWVLPMVFAAGMSLGATLQGAAGARIDGRLPVLNIAFTAAAAVVALIASAVRVLGPVPDGLPGRVLGFLGDVFVTLFRLLRRLLNYLLDRPGLLLLLLIVLVVVVALRRRKTDSGSGAAPARPARTAASPGPAKPGLADRIRTALRDRKEAGARKKATREQERQAREREKAAQRARQEAAARSAAAPRPAPASAAPRPATYARGRSWPHRRPCAPPQRRGPRERPPPRPPSRWRPRPSARWCSRRWCSRWRPPRSAPRCSLSSMAGRSWSPTRTTRNRSWPSPFRESRPASPSSREPAPAWAGPSRRAWPAPGTGSSPPTWTPTAPPPVPRRLAATVWPPRPSARMSANPATWNGSWRWPTSGAARWSWSTRAPAVGPAR